MTSNGRVSIGRRRWQARVGGGVMPVDALLDAAEASVSLGARELCCRLNATGKSFARTVDQLKHAAQLFLGETLLRQVVEAEGKRVLAASESGSLAPRWQAKDCKVKTPEGKEVSRAYLGIDGFMVPLLTEVEKLKRRQKVVAARAKRTADKPKLPPLPRRKKGTDQRYKEFKLVQYHDESMERRLVSVTRKPCEEAGRIMRRDARRIGFEEADERIANIDGGPWILNLLMNWTVVLSAWCLDFWHLGQHVNEGKRATFGEESEPGKQWAAQAMHQARHAGYDPFWNQLVDWRGKQRGGKRKEADKLLSYVASRKEMIVYDECERHGWRISSSTTESECGAAPHRVKGSGKRWDADNAEAVVALETLHQSNLWNEYWTNLAAQMN
ncbi:MAG: hypothetical protein WB760_26390 [Xanthobacteraceae bacterium]